MTLTTYAVGHFEMLNIDKRFEAVIARNPKYSNNHGTWAINIARDVARHQRYLFSNFLFTYHTYTRQKP